MGPNGTPKDVERAMFEKLRKMLSIDAESVERRHQDLRLKAADVVRDLCLSCSNCNSLAAPIITTSRRYRCLSCARQFESSPHDVEYSLGHSGRMTTTGARVMFKSENYERILDLIKSRELRNG